MEKIEMIKMAYEMAMRNASSEFCVIEDAEGKLNIYEFSAGSGSCTAGEWSGTETRICGFCFQGWSPEDGDQDFMENLISYLSDQQISELESAEKEIGEPVSDRELMEMFPEQYEDYCEAIIQSELDEFAAEEFAA